MIAEKLGMTVAELNATMTDGEFHQWRAFLSYRAALTEAEQKKAQAKAPRGRR